MLSRQKLIHPYEPFSSNRSQRWLKKTGALGATVAMPSLSKERGNRLFGPRLPRFPARARSSGKLLGCAYCREFKPGSVPTTTKSKWLTLVVGHLLLVCAICGDRTRGTRGEHRVSQSTALRCVSRSCLPARARMAGPDSRRLHHRTQTPPLRWRSC